MGHQGSICRPVPGASLSDIVSVRQWLTSAEGVRAYVEVRSKFMIHKPAPCSG
jgi:hypothetical protein